MEEETPTWPILIEHMEKSGLDKFELIWEPEKMPINKPIKIKYFNSSLMALTVLREGYLLGKADTIQEYEGE